jgi:hypothetical protein
MQHFSSPRYFRIWKFEIGHGQLLLRSTKEDYPSGRLDVYFTRVKFMNIPVNMKGLSIIEGAPNDSIEIYSAYKGVFELCGKTYHIEGEHYKGFIVADDVVWHSDNGNYDDPSYWQF